jgi:hypothetical protein
MAVKPSVPTLTARQTEAMAADLDSRLLMKAAEKRRRKEQQMLQHKIGKVTMKVIDGEYYQLRPHGWVRVDSLSDILFEDVRELPITQRVKSVHPCRIETGGEVHKVNVSFPIRNDLTRIVIEERVALGLAKFFGGHDADVYIGHHNEITHYRITGDDNVASVGTTVVEVGGGTTINLEV